MLSHQQPIHILLFLLIINSPLSAALPKPVPTDSPPNKDGAIPGGVDETGADDSAGAGGKPGGSVNLSKGAQIAIIVIVTLVVIFGVTSAILFYLAKKRQWEMRAKLRRSARRVTASLKSPGLKSPMSYRPRSSRPRTAAGEAALASSSRDSSQEPRRPTKPSSKARFASSNLKNESRHSDDHKHDKSRKEHFEDVEKGVKVKSTVSTQDDEVPQEGGFKLKNLNPFSQRK